MFNVVFAEIKHAELLAIKMGSLRIGTINTFGGITVISAYTEHACFVTRKCFQNKRRLSDAQVSQPAIFVFGEDSCVRREVSFSTTT